MNSIRIIVHIDIGIGVSRPNKHDIISCYQVANGTTHTYTYTYISFMQYEYIRTLQTQNLFISSNRYLIITSIFGFDFRLFRTRWRRWNQWEGREGRDTGARWEERCQRQRRYVSIASIIIEYSAHR